MNKPQVRSLIALLLLVLIAVLSGCRSKGSSLTGKWVRVDNLPYCDNYMRGFQEIEFIEPNRLVYYELFDGNENAVPIDAEYEVLDSNRVVLTSKTGLMSGADTLTFEVKDSQLHLCNGSDCCSFGKR